MYRGAVAGEVLGGDGDALDGEPVRHEADLRRQLRRRRGRALGRCKCTLEEEMENMSSPSQLKCGPENGRRTTRLSLPMYAKEIMFMAPTDRRNVPCESDVTYLWRCRRPCWS